MNLFTQDSEWDDSIEWLNESILYERIVYGRINRTNLFLPKGSPRGKNTLIGLIGKTLPDALDQLKSGRSLKLSPSYHYLIKPYISTRTLFHIRKRLITDRNNIRDLAKKNSLLWMSSPNSSSNTIQDLSDEWNLFSSIAVHRTISQITDQFLPYLRSCLVSLPKPELQKNLLVIDIRPFYFSRSTPPNQLKGNLLYLIYRMIREDNEAFSKWDIDIVLMGYTSSLVINPSRMTPKEKKSFQSNLFPFLKINKDILDKLEQKMQKEEPKEVVPDVPVEKGLIQSPYQKEPSLQEKPKDSPKEDKKPTDEKHPLLTTIQSEVDDTTPNNIFQDTVDTVTDGNEEETPPSEDPEDEIFVPFSEEDPFGEVDTKPKRTQTARVRSKLIEPDSAKQRELLKQQSKIVVRGNKTIQQETEIIPMNVEVPTTDHSKVMASENEEITSSRYENFRKTYMEQGFDSDMTKAFLSLNDKDNAFYIKDIKITDHSDSMNYQELWEVTLLDQYGVQSTIKLDIPKLYDNKYFLIGGNLKTLENQNAPLPIVKTGPNRVIISTNYNKIFMERYDTRSTTTVTRLAKMVSYDENGEYFTTGDSRIDNRNYDIPLSMSEIGKHIITFRSGSTQLYFNMKLPIMQKHNADENPNKVWIGKIGSKDIWVDKQTGRTEDGKEIIDLLLDAVPQEYRNSYESVKIGKVNMYARMKMNMKQVPCLFILGFWSGLKFILEKSGVEYRFVPDDTGRGHTNPSEIKIRFADGTLYYKTTDFSELLLNPLMNLNTKDLNFNDFDVPETWEDVLVNIYGSYRSINVIKAFHEWMIDWITLEILQAYHLPENITELVIYGIKLLTNNQYIPEISDELQRTRHAEVIPAMVYYRLATQYAVYSATGGRSKMTLPQDAIIKDLLSLTTLEDASIINPALELSKDASISKRGYRGTNLDDAYTRALRTYDHSSVGKIAMTTATGPNVGVQKFLTHEPDFTNIRGIRDPSKPVNQYNGANLMSSVEMLIPLAATHDDATRVAMGIKQAGHVVAHEVSSPSLLSSGADEAIRFRLSSEYVVNADEDGKVVEYDKASGMMIVQYKPYDAKPPRYRAFKLSPDIVKNSGGGIYFEKQLTTHLKPGDTFKKGEPLAYHDKFFTYSKYNGLRYNIGPLLRVIMYATSENYEDGGWITEEAAKMMATSIVYQESAQLDRNATITEMKRIGDHVNINDRLLTFSSGTSDAQLNRLLSMLDDSTSDDLKQGKRTEHAGTIVDIIVYTQVDPEDCSPSVKKLLNDYRTRIQRVSKILDKYDKSDGIVKAGYMNRTPDDQVTSKYGKIKGLETDILIEFYVKHTYNLGIGDKISIFSANKNTNSKIIPDELAGWSEDNPDDKIQAAMAPSPLAKRMLFSSPLEMAYTTCLIELERKILRIWDEK